MHKRFPGVTKTKAIWAAAPWAKYVIKVEGVYIAFDGEESAGPYIPDDMTNISRRSPHGKGHWNQREAPRG